MKNFQHHFIEIPVPLGTDICQVEIFNKEAKLIHTKLDFSNLGQVIDKWNIYFFDNKTKETQTPSTEKEIRQLSGEEMQIATEILWKTVIKHFGQKHKSNTFDEKARHPKN